MLRLAYLAMTNTFALMRLLLVGDRDKDVEIPAPQRDGTSWAGFLRSQADALLARDFLETRTLDGTRLYVFAVMEHANRRIRVLGATTAPTADWTTLRGSRSHRCRWGT